jgi:hypothetical protein
VKELKSRRLVVVAALATSLVAIAGLRSTAIASPGGTLQSAPHTATVAVMTTRESASPSSQRD